MVEYVQHLIYKEFSEYNVIEVESLDDLVAVVQQMLNGLQKYGSCSKADPKLVAKAFMLVHRLQHGRENIPEIFKKLLCFKMICLIAADLKEEGIVPLFMVYEDLQDTRPQCIDGKGQRYSSMMDFLCSGFTKRRLFVCPRNGNYSVNEKTKKLELDFFWTKPTQISDEEEKERSGIEVFAANSFYFHREIYKMEEFQRGFAVNQQGRIDTVMPSVKDICSGLKKCGQCPDVDFGLPAKSMVEYAGRSKSFETKCKPVCFVGKESLFSQSLIPLFAMYTNNKNSPSAFIDIEGNEYSTIYDFLKSGFQKKIIVCCPRGGQYERMENGALALDFYVTGPHERSHIKQKCHEFLNHSIVNTAILFCDKHVPSKALTVPTVGYMILRIGIIVIKFWAADNELSEVTDEMGRWIENSGVLILNRCTSFLKGDGKIEKSVQMIPKYLFPFFKICLELRSTFQCAAAAIQNKNSGGNNQVHEYLRMADRDSDLKRIKVDNDDFRTFLENMKKQTMNNDMKQ